MDIDKAVVARALKNLREEKGLSQPELARLLDKTQQAVDAWERSVALPSPNMLSRLADIFNVSTDYLLGKTMVRQPVETIAAHRADGYLDMLPPEKQREIERFIKFTINEHRQNQGLPPLE